MLTIVQVVVRLLFVAEPIPGVENLIFKFFSIES